LRRSDRETRRGAPSASARGACPSRAWDKARGCLERDERFRAAEASLATPSGGRAGSAGAAVLNNGDGGGYTGTSAFARLRRRLRRRLETVPALPVRPC